jgi:RNA polymerase sigma-70 factor (ECF subfamily)
VKSPDTARTPGAAKIHETMPNVARRLPDFMLDLPEVVLPPSQAPRGENPARIAGRGREIEETVRVGRAASIGVARNSAGTYHARSSGSAFRRRSPDDGITAQRLMSAKIKDETETLLQCHDAAARQKFLAQVFVKHRERLGCMLRIRIVARIRSRIDTSDVLQNTFIEASRRLEEYVAKPPMSLLLWLRRIAEQKLGDLNRFHLFAKRRAVNKEVPMEHGPNSFASSEAMALELIGKAKAPVESAAQKEVRAHLEEALEQMEPTDREILALRHFEELTNVEAAAVLGIKETAARKRYFRAISRLRKVIHSLPGGADLL